MHLLQGTIEDLTFISNVSIRDQRSGVEGAPDGRVISPELVSTLAPRRLVLAMGDTATGNIGNPSLTTICPDVWHSLRSVRTLELRHMRADKAELLHLVRGFESLENLILCNIALRLPRGHPRTDDMEVLIWLCFCMELRKNNSDANIKLSQVQGPKQDSMLPDCAVNWICDMAVPPGAVLDFEREDRLIEDYRSFLPLWAAESSDRGRSALREWDDILGRRLCDAAMSRRWR